MSAGHTPGPWGVSQQTNSFWILGDINKRDADGDVVTNIIANTNKAYGASKNSEANARLIAAAPELLNVAKLIRRAYANGPYHTFHTRLSEMAGGDFAQTLADAITKATGKESA